MLQNWNVHSFIPILFKYQKPKTSLNDLDIWQPYHIYKIKNFSSMSLFWLDLFVSSKEVNFYVLRNLIVLFTYCMLLMFPAYHLLTIWQLVN
jgi:hypothetical protein